MASQNDQRATDFEEVKRILEQQPRITLMQTEGEPPDCYEIEYRLAGMVRDADGTIRKASQHVVLITLPFGYPHFPPTVKPLTPLFHPDIDPDAVRISSHWQQSPSLAKLIVQVGEMICGKNYNLEDPFNQEAADWYAQHATELPLDSLEVASDESIDEFDLGLDDLDLGPTGGTTEEQSFELSLELESPQAVHDVLADASADHQGGGTGGLSLELESSSTTIEEDFDLGVEDGQEDDLSLDIGEPETPPQVVQQDFGPKLKEIRSHIDRKEIFIAARLLKEVPALPETEILKKKVKAAQDKCDELLQNMKVLEDEDNFAAAQEVFTQLKTVAIDTPGLAEIGRRLQQSQSMLDTFALTKEKTEPETELPGAEKKKKIGFLPNVFTTLAQAPVAFDTYLQASAILGKTSLSAQEKKPSTSPLRKLNGCDYCLSAHTMFAGKAGLSPQDIVAARQGELNAYAALARQLTETRGHLSDEQLAAARAAGIDDRKIIEVIALVAVQTLTN
ncbi:carboxymuconolactone decarboxylase family protein, partial [Desulfobulbus sp. F1]|nr:carboxymuconolactone decarboxylase family protein [Desulfobulbus sp. F1]